LKRDFFKKPGKNQRDFELFEKVPFEKGFSESPKKSKRFRTFSKSLFFKRYFQKVWEKQKRRQRVYSLQTVKN